MALFWIAVLLAVCASIAIAYQMRPIANDQAAMASGGLREFSLDEFWALLRMWIVVALIFNYILLVATINRLHDRGKSGWRILWYFVPFAAAAAYFALLPIVKDVENAPMALTISVLAIIGLCVIAQLMMLIECAFLPGDEWGNEYGRSPGES